MRRVGFLAAVLLVSALLAGGCSSSEEPAAGEAAPQTAPAAPRLEPPAQPVSEPPPATTAPPPAPAAPKRTTPCEDGAVVAMVTPRRAFGAFVRERATAYRAPDGAELASFGPRNVNRFPTVFGVLAKRVDADCRPAWYRVQLPLRPNGVTGWVRADDVELRPVRTRIVVELAARRVTLFEDGRETFSAPVAIGTAATPTPTGRYYVNQRLIPRDKSGPFGPGAIGISAFSPVLTGWAQGGPIAIHGTNRPELIGQAVSNGCIRVRNDHLLHLFERALAGTPVHVQA